jgi:DNA-binding Lrp family transcriptional regulator
MTGIDNLDAKILHNLEKDGRISNTNLAERVGLSPSACLRRVQDLERRNIIKGYRAIIDRSQMGGSIVVFVSVGLSDHRANAARDFELAMMAASEVRECHNITGAIEYLLRIEVSSLDAYKRFHSEILGARKEVISITSHICLGSAKDERA